MPKRRQEKKLIKGSKTLKVSEQRSQTTDSANEQMPRPDIYTKRPEQPKDVKPGQLTEEQLVQFFDKGYVLLKNFFDKKLLEDSKMAISDLVEDLAQKLYNAGRIKNKHEDKELFERLTYLEKEFPGASVLLHKADILPPALQRLWSDDRLLNIIEQLIGPEISGHPNWNLRPKTPQNEQLTVPWHQDNAYLDALTLNSLIPTAWIPFLDTNKENGCMQVAVGGHRKGITATHTCCAGGTWYIDLAEEEMKSKLDIDMDKDIVTCEVPYGGVLLFSNAIPHRSLENFSDKIRWSIDLRWHKTGEDSGCVTNDIAMRSEKNPDHKIDWSQMKNSGRNKVQALTIGMNHDDLEPVISGPWMKRWKIVHHNKHTANEYKSQVYCKP